MAPMHQNPEALRAARTRTIDRLSEHFVRDDIDVAEFERRLAEAHRAESLIDVEQVVADLPALDAAAPGATAAAAPVALGRPAPAVPASAQRPHGFAVAIMSGAQRRGTWTPPRQLTAIALMGGVELDFREARLAPGVTDVSVVALMGGVEIVVPPSLAVETSGFGLMGGFDHVERSSADPDPELPLLRIRGLAVMGGVEVKTRLAGESPREARRRARRERREQRRR